MVEVVFWTYCGQWSCCNTGAKDHSTITHIFRAAPPDNPLGGNTPADTTGYTATPYRALDQAGLENSSAGGVNPKASIESGLGGDPDIGFNSVYDCGSLGLVVHLFIGDAITSESNPSTQYGVDVGAPYFWSDDLFFGNNYREKLDANSFYDAVQTLHKTGTLANDDAVPTSGGED